MKAEVTYGSDPEFMLFDRELNRIVSAIGVLNNDKHTPHDLGDGFRVYADNVLVETSFNPTKSKDGIIDSIRKAIAKIHAHVGSRYHLIANSAHIYEREDMMVQEAWAIGCDPNFNAYTMKENHPSGFKDFMRTGSCHLHIGHPLLSDPKAKANAVKLLDIYLGCASVIFDKDPTAILRRSLYGRAGEYRPTPYGIEYRVLGGFPLRSPVLMDLVMDIVGHAIEFVDNGSVEEVLKSSDQDTVCSAINDCKPELAESVLRSHSTPASLIERIKSGHNPVELNEWFAK